MALIVEDGTGREDAESYIAVAEFRAFCTGAGIDVAAMTDSDIEIAARKGTRFVDTEGEYRGQVKVNAQALEFPRVGLTWHGREIVGVPKRVKDAVVVLGLASRAGPLRVDMERGGRIKSEAVGPISTTYMDDAPAGRVYVEAMALLKPYLRTGRPDGVAPGWTPPAAAPAFSLNGDDRFKVNSLDVDG